MAHRRKRTPVTPPHKRPSHHRKKKDLDNEVVRGLCGRLCQPRHETGCQEQLL